MLNRKSKAILAITLLLATLTSQTLLSTQAEPTIASQLIDLRGVGASIFFDSQNNPNVLYSKEVADIRDPITRMYAHWNGQNWSTQIVNNDANNIFIMDTNNKPHIISTVNDNLKDTPLADSNWTISDIGISRVADSRTMILDKKGTLHTVSSDYVYFDGNRSYTSRLYYNIWTGAGKSTQIIDEKNSTAQVAYQTLSPVSITLDSNGNPNIIFVEKTEIVFHLKHLDFPSFNTTHILKYAKWTGQDWAIQTVALNATAASRLVLDSIGQPRLCYIHLNSTFFPNYGSYLIRNSLEYTHFDGYHWVNKTIEPESTNANYNPMIFRLDTNGNPQVCYYRTDYQNQNNTGLTIATWNGGAWDKEIVWVAPRGSYGNALISDMEFDSNGNLHLTYTLGVGTYRSALRYGELTYVYIETPKTAQSSLLPIAAVSTAVIIVVIWLAFFKLKRKKGQSSQVQSNL